MKKWIFWAIAIVVVIAIILYVKWVNPFATLLNLACIGGGIVAGWFARIFYVKYIDTPKKEN